MLQSSKERKELEKLILRPEASLSEKSLGRKYTELPHPLRSCFARDRDRILHSRCFRRLEYKTQVFVNGTADHYRTRLTHTMEMAAVGRTIARILQVNEDLTEAIALAHDIGHSPFGHAGEHVLDDLMAEHGGFDHNLQSLRCVETIESQYPDFPGLNLTWEVRAGLLKHEAHVAGAELDGHPIGPFQSLEAQIADIADDMTYHAHDVDDGLEAGIVTPDQLAETKFWKMAQARTNGQYSALDQDQHQRITIRNLLDLQAEDVIRVSMNNLERIKPQSVTEVMNAPTRTVDFSSEMHEILKDFSDFMFKNLYFHQSIEDATQRATRMMRELFLHYVAHPETMGRKARGRIEQEGIHRTACDYVAGCTDRYAMEEYLRFDLGQN